MGFEGFWAGSDILGSAIWKRQHRWYLKTEREELGVERETKGEVGRLLRAVSRISTVQIAAWNPFATMTHAILFICQGVQGQMQFLSSRPYLLTSPPSQETILSIQCENDVFTQMILNLQELIYQLLLEWTFITQLHSDDKNTKYVSHSKKKKRVQFQHSQENWKFLERTISQFMT